MEELVKNPIVLVAFGLGLAIMYGTRWLGLREGEKSSAGEGHAAAQVAAVIVDPTALNAAKDAVIELTKALLAGQASEKDYFHSYCRRVDKLTEVVAELADEMGEVRKELYIQREIAHSRK
jgi:hypothetical protein